MLQMSYDLDHSNYVLIDSLSKYEDLLRSVSNTKRLSWDYETSAVCNDNYLEIQEKQRPLDMHRSTITSASFRTSDGLCYYLSIDHLNSFNMPKEAIKDVLMAKPKDVSLSAHNHVFEWFITKNCLGLDLREIGPLRDTMIAAKLLDSNQAVGLKDLTKRFLNVLQTSYKSVTDGLRMNELTAEQVLAYGCDDSEYQWQLEEIFDKQIKDNDLWTYYTELEMPLAPIIADMTLFGAYVDEEVLAKKTEQHLAQMGRLSKELYAILGKEVNLASPTQMTKVLYGTLGLPMPPYAESNTATDKESLYWNINLHPFVGKFLEYKMYETRYKLYDKPYRKLIHPDTGMIHSQLRQTVTDTGRFSSSGPNLQQLAKRGSGVEVRELFSPPPGYDHIMSLDLSQIELVLAGHMSQSPVMMKAYGTPRGDLHTATCMALFHITAEEAKANKTYRQSGKTCNFSLLYGGAAKRIYRLVKLDLAKMNLECPFTMRDIDAMIAAYFNLYPEIKTLQKNDIMFAKENGYIKSLFGRKFYLPDINDRNSFLRSKAERKATNTRIQGTAAEILKRAIIKIDNERIPKEDMRMWASIHDENCFYVRDGFLKDAAHICHKHMADTPKGLRTTVESDVTFGPNFGKMKNMEGYIV
jgi:DNA polymerase-1